MSEEKRKKLLLVGVIVLVLILIAGILVPPVRKKVTEDPQAQQESAQAEPVTYDMLTDMPAGYVFHEDPMVRSGMEIYTEALTGLYQKNDSEQQAVCMSLEEALEEAGLSRTVYLDIMNYQGTSLEENKEISRIKEKGSVYDENAAIYLMTSKDESNLFYIGERKNNRPNGSGAIFQEKDGRLSLVFVGTFESGMKTGKGVSFASYGPFSFVERVSRYKKGIESGKALEYQVLEQKNMRNRCKAMEDIVDEFDDDQDLFTNIYNNVQTTDPEAVILKWLVRKPSAVYLDQPVIRCALSYKGSLKNGQRSGRGTQYDVFGRQIYQGAFKDGLAKTEAVSDKAEEYPSFSKEEFLAMYHQGFVSRSRQAYYTETELDEYARAKELEERLNELANADSVKKKVSTAPRPDRDETLVIRPESEIATEYPTGVVRPNTGYYSTYQRPGWIPEYRPSQYEQNTASLYRPYVPSHYESPTTSTTQFAPSEPDAAEEGTTVIDISEEE